MSNIQIEESYIPEFITDTISSSRINSVAVSNDVYHHNTSYKHTSEIIKHGIMSAEEKAKRGLFEITPQLEHIYNGEHYVNGLQNISLAKVGLTDLYPDEDEYDPYSSFQTDILITDALEPKPRRSSVNYGNEFLVQGIILPEYFKSIDFRLLKYIEQYKQGRYSKEKMQFLLELIEKYNCLRQIAKALKDSNLDIPFREMSTENITLDPEKVLNFPILSLSKK